MNNEQDTKSDIGQYFTPRPLIKAIIAAIPDSEGKTIYDPTCDMKNFLLMALDIVLANPPYLKIESED